MGQIKTKINNAVFEIEICRYEAKNALSIAMYQSLVEAFEQFTADSNLHVALIYGSDTCFCAGNDLKDFMASAELDDEHPTVQFIHAIANCKKPIVAAVAGPAIGIGTTMLLHFDLVIAATNCKFQMPFTHLGLCPEAGSSLLLPQKIGHVKAFEYLVLGNAFDAATALQLGLINQMVEANKVIDTAQARAQNLSQLPAAAVQQSKALMKNATGAATSSAIGEELKVFSSLLHSKEAQNRIGAFFKR